MVNEQASCVVFFNHKMLVDPLPLWCKNSKDWVYITNYYGINIWGALEKCYYPCLNHL